MKIVIKAKRVAVKGDVQRPMTGNDVWNITRWAIGLYLIGLGSYSLATGRMPRVRRPHSPYPFPRRREHTGTTAVVLAIICIAAGLLVMFVRP